MRSRRDSSGFLVLGVGVVLAVMSLAAAFGNDETSAVVFGLLALAALAANLVLRSHSGRPARADLAITRGIVVVFAGAFASIQDWTLVAVAAGATIAAEAVVRLTSAQRHRRSV